MNNTVQPTIIVITPMRNEAWVLDAFLTCTSSWADYIILADQHSTDGSREIAAKYEKVILVDNDSPEMDQAAARLLLFREVDKIEGDKIVFALDADEFLSEGFEESEGWNRIINSKPNEIFCFKWLNLYEDYRHSLQESGFTEWACHFESSMSIAEEYDRCERRAVHEMRIPCLPTERAEYIMIPDIRFVHLSFINPIRTRNKQDFYEVSTLAKLTKQKSAVTMFRSYHHPAPELKTFKDEIALRCKGDKGYNARQLVSNDHGQYYIDEMLSIFKRDGVEKYLKLDIWDNPFLKAAKINPRFPVHIRIIHWYLKKTQRITDKKIVKWVDKLLKLLC